MSQRPAIVWRITDEKAGHLNQSRGLVNALAECVPLETFEIKSPSRWQSLWSWLWVDFPPARDLPNPDLIVGAGHGTHLALLAAKRARGGKTILLGKPTLPAACFDLCLTPESDDLAARDNVILTQGVLNIIHPSERHEENLGLILIGGPSGSHAWNNDEMLEQVAEIVTEQSSVQWQLTTSRRTPADFAAMLSALKAPNLTVVPHEQTSAAWVPEQLAHSSQVWVSEDSVSMVYESLTSGAAVGVLTVPCKRAGRVTRGMARLCEQKWITCFADWDRSSRLSLPPQQIDEAHRCAQIVCERLLASESPVSETALLLKDRWQRNSPRSSQRCAL